MKTDINREDFAEIEYQIDDLDNINNSYTQIRIPLLGGAFDDDLSSYDSDETIENEDDNIEELEKDVDERGIDIEVEINPEMESIELNIQGNYEKYSVNYFICLNLTLNLLKILFYPFQVLTLLLNISTLS